MAGFLKHNTLINVLPGVVKMCLMSLNSYLLPKALCEGESKLGDENTEGKKKKKKTSTAELYGSNKE